jgi:hypothetical protein
MFYGFFVYFLVIKVTNLDQIRSYDYRLSNDIQGQDVLLFCESFLIFSSN